MPADHPSIANQICSAAAILRGTYLQSEYGRVFLPFTVLRRLDCMLEPTEKAARSANRKYGVLEATGLRWRPSYWPRHPLFHSTSPLDLLEKLAGDKDNIGGNLRSRIRAFPHAVRDIFESLGFRTQIDRLDEAGLLHPVTEKFATIDLHPVTVSAELMGAVFEELVRRFPEMSDGDGGCRPIRDALGIYTSYRLAFKPGDGSVSYDEKAIGQAAAMRRIIGERLDHIDNGRRVRIVVEQFREKVAPLLDGRGKALVETANHREAVHWKLAMDNYIAGQSYPINTLVAGADPGAGREDYNTANPYLNPTLGGRDILEAFKGDEYQILIVGNKRLTSLDEPLLCGLYVVKGLCERQYGTTLSHLNRRHPGKDTVHLVDFINSPGTVLEGLREYNFGRNPDDSWLTAVKALQGGAGEDRVVLS